MSLVHVEPGGAAGVWHVVLDRPPVNAFSFALYEELLAAFDRVEADGDLRCLVLASAVDGAFSAGADTKELAVLNSGPADEKAWSTRDALTTEYLRRLATFGVPTIAAVDGYAIGAGFVMASLCDIRVASHRARFSIPELAVHRAGGARHAMRVLPAGVVRHLYLTRDSLDAARAHELGLVTELVPDGTARNAADQIAVRIAETPAVVLREAKAALQLMEELPTEAGVQVERLYSRRMAQADPQEPPR